MLLGAAGLLGRVTALFLAGVAAVLLGRSTGDEGKSGDCHKEGQKSVHSRCKVWVELKASGTRPETAYLPERTPMSTIGGAG